ncbi:MAG: hypothetical protein DRP78_04810 [Candidatus Omnitrophota bacterium]|nr:MAG: hypothetical protein DRP78_04810 [Candidatus Omnitrophota bacterium]
MNWKKQYLFPTRNSGSILIIAIWTLVIFAILNTALYKLTISQLKIFKTLRCAWISPYLAKAAYVYALEQIAQDTTVCDTAYELHTPQKKNLGQGQFEYILIDTESKININKASIENLTLLPGVCEDIAENIFKSKLKPFHFKEELLLVEDMREDIFTGIKDIITVYGSGAVNINTACKDVFGILGMDGGLIKNIMDYRSGTDGVEGTEDDRVFEKKSEILNQLRAYTSLFAKQQTEIIELVSTGSLDVLASVFILSVNTKINGSEGKKYQITFNKQKILEWQEQ